MRVAAYQAPLLAAGSMDALGLIRTRVEWCEARASQSSVARRLFGGLADYGDPTQFAIREKGTASRIPDDIERFDR